MSAERENIVLRLEAIAARQAVIAADVKAIKDALEVQGLMPPPLRDVPKDDWQTYSRKLTPMPAPAPFPHNPITWTGVPPKPHPMPGDNLPLGGYPIVTCGGTSGLDFDGMPMEEPR